jgi:NADPH-dependent glutamate synthase beta subunit-like oxidoreductase
LAAAIRERIEVVRGYGCEIVDVGSLTPALEAALEQKPHEFSANGHAGSSPKPIDSKRTKKIITATDVLKAQQLGAPIRLRPSTVITALARDLAEKHGVTITTEV